MWYTVRANISALVVRLYEGKIFQRKQQAVSLHDAVSVLVCSKIWRRLIAAAGYCDLPSDEIGVTDEVDINYRN